jgi:hypothetical protein
MTFEDYFFKLKTSHLAFRDKVCTELDISIETFYLKKKKNSWNAHQREVISKVSGISVKNLFPKINI